MIDDDTLKDLLRIDDDLFQVCKWLDDKRDTATSSRLIPEVEKQVSTTNFATAVVSRFN
jgi:hypothetical protein